MGRSKPETDAVWAGEEDLRLTGATAVPVSLGVAHAYPDVDTWVAVALGRAPGHIYARGIPEGLIRYSAGIEAVEDLIADLTQALD